MYFNFKELKIKILEVPRRKIRVYFIFLFLSFCFWFLNTMSRDHESTLILPIKYSHFPIEKIVVDSSLVNDIQVRVKAPGITLLLHNLFYRKHINIRVDDAYWRNNQVAFWIMNNRRKEISNALSQNIQIITVLPDTVRMNFTKKHAKLVPVKFTYDMTFQERFRLSKDIEISPDSVFIYGDKMLLDNIEYLETDFIHLENISKNVSKKVKLKAIDNLLCNIMHVDIQINIEQYTEQDIDVPIGFHNLPSGYTIKLFPNTVKLKVSSSIEDYGMYDVSSFSVQVDCSNILKSERNNIPVNIIRQPSFITLHRIIPNKVEYILIKE